MLESGDPARATELVPLAQNLALPGEKKTGWRKRPVGSWRVTDERMNCERWVSNLRHSSRSSHRPSSRIASRNESVSAEQLGRPAAKTGDPAQGVPLLRGRYHFFLRALEARL